MVALASLYPEARTPPIPPMPPLEVLAVRRLVADESGSGDTLRSRFQSSGTRELSAHDQVYRPRLSDAGNTLSGACPPLTN